MATRSLLGREARYRDAQAWCVYGYRGRDVTLYVNGARLYLQDSVWGDWPLDLPTGSGQ